MLNENKNRGAGLVTVVVVLAVCSILLSASIWLSFNHYKNVVNSKSNDAEFSELDLCAELFRMSLISDMSDLSQFDIECPLISFYNCESATITVSEDKDELTISFINQDKLIIESEDIQSGILIHYYCNDSVISKEYTFEQSASDQNGGA